MSANEVAITQRMPKSRSAQGACSRLEPQPKFFPPMTNTYGLTNSSPSWNGTCPLGSPAASFGTPQSAYLPNIRSVTCL